MARFHLYWTLARPFTLIPPMVGIFSGALIGFAATRAALNPLALALAICGAAALNAGSNGLNQIFDLANDRINKPGRPLPAGRMTLRQAWALSICCYVAALALAAAVNAETFVLFLLGAVATVLYSAPPARLKRRTWSSNLVIALARGELLKVAGWAVESTVLGTAEPWYIGLIFLLFLAGATTTKDFADVEGDRAAGCLTLPVRYGVAASARLISPFFVLPWVVMALGVWLNILTGGAAAILALSALLTAWGVYVIYLINRDPGGLARDGENHPGWRHMYGMMMAGHLGLAVAYLLNLVR
ncbi:MAG: UbiA prenyltransferase family protein [Terriglobia bacterium]